MAAKAEESPLEKALGHPLRRRLIVALWHSSEPLTARRVEDEYLEDGAGGLATIVYHLRVLERAGVVAAADLPGERDEEFGTPPRGLVLGGENAGDAVRRLGLVDGREP